MLANTKQTKTYLKVYLQERRSRKRYRAIVFGKLEGLGGWGAAIYVAGEQRKDEGGRFPVAIVVGPSCVAGGGEREVESHIYGKPSLTRYKVIRKTRYNKPRDEGGDELPQWTCTPSLIGRIILGGT